MGVDQEECCGDEHDAAQDLFHPDVEVGCMSQDNYDKIREKESVLIVLCPQRIATQQMRVTLMDDCYVAPSILIRDVGSIVEKEEEVTDDRESESEDRDNIYQGRIQVVDKSRLINHSLRL